MRRVAARTCSMLIPGLYKAVPTPKPLALADIQVAKFSGATPPTAYTCVPTGSTARKARSPSVPRTEHGNILSPSAPALSAAKHSDGVSTPGQDASPRAFVARTTSASKFGETTILPPASATARTSSLVRTVPAPIVACSPNLSTRRAMLSRGRGELSGISIVVMPPAIRISPPLRPLPA